jgi:hypothetical protein
MNRDCYLSNEDRQTEPNSLKFAKYTDYLENQCVTGKLINFTLLLRGGGSIIPEKKGPLVLVFLKFHVRRFGWYLNAAYQLHTLP